MKIKTYAQAVCLLLATTIVAQLVFAGDQIKPSPNGITLPEAYKDWKVISVSHRIDNNSMRVILGNNIAVKAARAGETRPWPKGSILGKLVWKQKVEEHWPDAISADKFVHAEFMFKDSEKYKDTGGWGYARWLGMDQKPYGSDKNFALECMGCHTPVKDNDWVFTTPAILP